MRTHRLGRTDIEVSVLGFGAAGIGNLFTAVDDDTARAAVTAAWDCGVRYFDTAPYYGRGLSERRLGQALADRPRSEFVVSTKIGRVLVRDAAFAGTDPAPGLFDVRDELYCELDYSRDGVYRSFEASLTRLALDRVDIVYIHDAEQHMDTAIGQSVPALIELREQGVVRAIGAGMNTVGDLRRFVADTDIDVVMLANRWTLLDRTARSLLDDCARRGVAVVLAAPFNSGLLASAWPMPGAHFHYEPVRPAVLARARALARVCEQHGAVLPHAALQFPLLEPVVASVVTGMRTAHEARANAEGIQALLPPALWTDLDRAMAPENLP